MIYINDCEPFVASGLQAMHPEAVVDTTSIIHLNHQRGTLIPPAVKPVDHDFRQYEQCHFFAGIGGWPTALAMAKWPAGRPVWTGSCPCQPFSSAGKKKGQNDERHLWPDFFRQIERFRPAEVFGEQVASPDGLTWLTGVQTDLEAAGYFFWAVDLAAAGVGAPIIRQRLFWGARRRDIPSPTSSRRQGRKDARSGGSSESKNECGILEPERSDLPVCGTIGVGCGLPQRGSIGRVQSGAEQSRTRQAIELSGHTDSQLGQPDSVELSGLPPARKQSIHECNSELRETDHWSRFELVYFRDERHPGKYKARRIEPGLEPLAHGLPAGHAELLPRLLELGLDSATAKRCITLARTHRVGTIRGYGNAIVPQAAAQFLRAWLDVFP